MKHVLNTAVLILSFSFAVKASEIHDNTDNSKKDATTQVKQLLDVADIKFEASLENDVVRGIQSAAYYFDGISGILYVKFHNKELVYKDVPLKIWMEWKFSDSISSYYKQNIKYDFIPIG